MVHGPAQVVVGKSACRTGQFEGDLRHRTPHRAIDPERVVHLPVHRHAPIALGSGTVHIPRRGREERIEVGRRAHARLQSGGKFSHPAIEQANDPVALGEPVFHQQGRIAGAVADDRGDRHLVAVFEGAVGIELQHVGVVDGQLAAGRGAACLHHLRIPDRDIEPERGAGAGRIVLHARPQHQAQSQHHQTEEIIFHIGFHFMPPFGCILFSTFGIRFSIFPFAGTYPPGCYIGRVQRTM